MGVFNKIVNDEYIIGLYNDILKYEEKNKIFAKHDYTHVLNVTNMVETILKQLNYDEDIIEEAKIACILHDIGCIKGKEDHANRSYQMAKEYFQNNNIALKKEEEVLDAIKNHSDGFDTDNIITLVLIFSDKVDIKKERLTEEGYKVEGFKEIQHIEDIDIKIDEKNFTVNFITDKLMDKKALENYYFTVKVFKAIYSFANKIKLNPVVLIDNEKWKYSF
jgi:HD superfamily phosphohydrolase YqeK